MYQDINIIKQKAQSKIDAIDKTTTFVDQVKQVIEKFAGKSITGNKKRFQTAIQEINQDLRALIDWDQYSGAKLEIYFWDRTQGGYSEDSHFYILYYYTNKENIFDKENIFAEIDKFAESTQKEKARLEYTKNNIESVLAKRNQLIDDLNALLGECSSSILDFAGIKERYYFK